MSPEDLKAQLKQLLVEECDIDCEASEILDNEQLLGEECRLGLDSLDTLAIALEVKSRFGKHIGSGQQARQALSSVNALADHILNSAE